MLTEFAVTNASNMSYTLEDYVNGFFNFGDDSPEKVAANFIYVYISPIFLFFGSLCNLFSVLVLLRLSKKVLSTCGYLALLAILDTLVLYARCGNDWLREVAHVDISYNLLVRSEAICKVYPFFFNFIFHLARWLIVCVAVEGFIATRFAHKVYSMCTLSRTKSTILLLTVILVCMNVHFFWSYELVNTDEYNYNIPDQEGYMCTFNKHGHQYSEEFQMVIWPIMDLMLSEVLPLTIVSVCTVVMVVQILKGKHRGSMSHQAWRKRYILDPKALDQLKVVFMFLGIFYPLLTLPKLGYTIFTYLQEMYSVMPYEFTLESKRALAHATCASCEYFFFAFKFLLYVAVSQKFRQEFLSLFRCRHSKKQPNDIKKDSKKEPLIKSANTPRNYK